MLTIRPSSHVALGLIIALAACNGGSEPMSTTPGSAAGAAPTTVTAAAVTTPTTAAQPTVAPTTLAPTTVPSTTIALADLAVTYAVPGPFPVGVTTLTLATGNRVEVWYPAVEGTTGTETYDIRDYTPPAIKQVLTADIPATFSYSAVRNAQTAAGVHPLVLFSHGFSGVRVQSTFLTSHLASWGLVVAAPDHPARDLSAATSGAVNADPQVSIDDLLNTLALVTADNDPILDGHVDGSRVIAVGHSAGGGTVVGAANQSDSIDGFVSLASGFGRAENPIPPPKQPSLFMAGAGDLVVPAATATQPAFEQATPPSEYWLLGDVGHNGFDDFCTFGNGKGIIGIAEESGLGPFLDAQPQFRALGEDGCLPPNVPVTETFPIIRHAVTAWVRFQTGLDREPVGLGPEMSELYDIDVTVTVRRG